VSCGRSAGNSLSVPASGDGDRPIFQLFIDALKGNDRGVMLAKFL
jgi:hypothetical protein